MFMGLQMYDGCRRFKLFGLSEICGREWMSMGLELHTYLSRYFGRVCEIRTGKWAPSEYATMIFRSSGDVLFNIVYRR
jgi:hypothetical protein